MTKDAGHRTSSSRRCCRRTLQAEGPARPRQGGAGGEPREGDRADRRAPARAPPALGGGGTRRRHDHAGRREAAAAGQRRVRRRLLRVPRVRRAGRAARWRAGRHDDGAAAGRIAARAGPSRLRHQGAAARHDRPARRQDVSRRHGADGQHRRVDRRGRVVRAHQFRQQRRPGHACRRRARARGDRRPQDAVDGGRARSLAAAPARRAAVQADREPRRARRRPAPRRCAAGTSGVAQMPGMWFQIELRGAGAGDRAAVRFGRPRQRDAAAAAAARRGAAQATPPPPPVFLSPRTYACRYRWTARSGASRWRPAVATGSHTTIAFAPTRAQFVRITQTDNIAGAPAWSIRNLRVYEAQTRAATR